MTGDELMVFPPDLDSLLDVDLDDYGETVRLAVSGIVVKVPPHRQAAALDVGAAFWSERVSPPLPEESA